MCYNFKDCENTHNYDNCKYENREFNNNSCCMKRVEETYFCYPSYYSNNYEDCNENKKDEQFNPCYEGTFKICPKHCENKEYFNKYCNDNDHKRNETKHNCRCHHRCGFCGLFRRW